MVAKARKIQKEVKRWRQNIEVKGHYAMTTGVSSAPVAAGLSLIRDTARQTATVSREINSLPVTSTAHVPSHRSQARKTDVFK
jgi:hypothetical protein